MQAGSLIVSVFGDAIHPRGGVVWLGCLIRLLEPLALNERLIRTAIFRLVKDEWLETQTLGRRTDYGLSRTGRARIEEASKLIYSGQLPAWDGQWRIMMTTADMPTKMRMALRKALYWQGFGQLNTQAFVHPSADLNQVVDTLQTEGVLSTADTLLTFMSNMTPTAATLSNQEVVQQSWDLKHLGQGYQGFIQQYRPLLSNQAAEAASDEDAFLLRILLVHDFRRLLLRDPMLPSDLMPGDWPGVMARQLFNRLYAQLQLPSERHLDAQLLTANQITPPRGAIFKKRIATMRLDSVS